MKIKMRLKIGLHPARAMKFLGHDVNDIDWSVIELNEAQAILLKSKGVTHWYDVAKVEEGEEPVEVKKKATRNRKKKVTKKDS